MELNLLKPRIALNKVLLKVKPNLPEIELFKKNLISRIDNIDEYESEEFHKNEVSDFLKNTYNIRKQTINSDFLQIRNDILKFDYLNGMN